MANEIKFPARALTGETLYAVVLNSAGAAYNGSTFETLEADNWATYDIALTESDSLGIWLGTFPAVAAGLYAIQIYQQAGASPATSDEQVGVGTLDWSGSAESTARTLLRTETLIDGKTVVESLQIIAATTAGKVSGAGTGTEVFKALDGATTRVTVTVDDDGNRSTVTYA